MARKRCSGQIDEYPVCQKFISVQSGNDKIMTLGLEEFEAIRLKDMARYDQEECAKQMGLTRPTFQRMLIIARKKIATALVEGQTIAIEGGNYQKCNRVFECIDCSHTWKAPPCAKGGKHGCEINCPVCGSLNKSKIVNGVRHVCSRGPSPRHIENDTAEG